MTLPEGLEIREFDGQTATEAEYQALTAFTNRMEAEYTPADPPQTLREMKQGRITPPSQHYDEWAVWHHSEIVATGSLSFARSERNQHLAHFWVNVLPEYRRQGIARQLLHRVATAAERENRTLLTSGADSQIPAAEAFLRRTGARITSPGAQFNLDIANLDHALLRDWQARGSALSAEFEMGVWEGAYPEADLEQIAKMHEVMWNAMPHGSTEREDDTVTVQEMREWDATNAQMKRERWTIYVLYLETDTFVGYTEVFWSPERAEELHQGDTGVFAEFQNHGLGSWLKAAMLEKVIRDRPQVTRVRTWNNSTNAPMLLINERLGFKPHRTGTNWQVELGRVMEYLASRPS